MPKLSTSTHLPLSIVSALKVQKGQVICLSDKEISRSRTDICPCNLYQCPSDHVICWEDQVFSSAQKGTHQVFPQGPGGPPNRCTSPTQKTWGVESLKDSRQSVLGGPVGLEVGVGFQPYDPVMVHNL